LSLIFKIKNLKYNVIVQIVTCTGQERFLSTREYVLEGADGVIFVGDSDPEKLEENKRSFRELISFTRASKIPYVIQLNKRDLKNAISLINFKKQLGLPEGDLYPNGSPVVFPVIAIKGVNVLECFWDLITQILIKIL